MQLAIEDRQLILCLLVWLVSVAIIYLSATTDFSLKSLASKAVWPVAAAVILYVVVSVWVLRGGTSWPALTGRWRRQFWRCRAVTTRPGS